MLALASSQLARDEYDISFYPGASIKGVKGDQLIIAPPYTIKAKDVKHIVNQLCLALNTYFGRMEILNER